MSKAVKIALLSLLFVPVLAFAQLIDAESLADEMESNKNLVILGIDEAGNKLEGSVLIDSKKIRVKGNVPDANYFTEMMQNAGVNANSKVVIVEEGKGASSFAPAARLYWTLKYYGHKDVSILGGGVVEWEDMGEDTTDGLEKAAKKGNFKAKTPNKAIKAETAEVEKSIGKATIVDVRPINDYLGLTQPKAAKQKGHIDTAKTADMNLYFKTGSNLTDKASLEKLFADLKINTNSNPIFYCNTGNQASVGWFVVSEILGKKAKVFDESMTEWEGKVSQKLQN